MANIKLIFQGSELSSSDKTELICEVNVFNEILISIKDTEIQHDYNEQFICLNKSTAVRLVRELKKQIGLMEGGNYNG